MLQQLINHSPDLYKLQEDGYLMDLVGNGGYIIIRQVPYLNAAKEVKFGALLCPLTLASPTRVGKPDNHTMLFCGEAPYNVDGTIMNAIIHHSNPQHITEGIIANHMFSSKPSCGYYDNYYEKFRTYAEILQTQARLIDPTVTARPNKKSFSDGKRI